MERRKEQWWWVLGSREEVSDLENEGPSVRFFLMIMSLTGCNWMFEVGRRCCCCLLSFGGEKQLNEKGEEEVVMCVQVNEHRESSRAEEIRTTKTWKVNKERKGCSQF